jgi:hypothetical protein
MVALGIAITPVGVYAKPPKKADSAPLDPNTAQAAEEFVKGTEAVKAGQWNEALAHFERANQIKPSPIAVFNIGYCQRATGRYVLAIQSFDEALKRADAMPAAQADEAKAFAAELRAQLVHVKVTLDPPNARITVDGRPLIALGPGNDSVLVAGVAPAGEGTTPKQPVFEMLVDPGMRLVTASFPGHANILLSKEYAPGATEELPIKLKELPATVRIEANQARAVVMVDGRDVGLAPVRLTRPAGSYQLQILKHGFVTYETSLRLTPGQNTQLTARLTAEREAITQKWWFWGGAAAIVAGGVTAVYLLSRPDAQPAGYQRGSMDWLAQP